MEDDCFETIDEDANPHLQVQAESQEIGASIPSKLGALPNPILPIDKSADEYRPVRWRFAVDDRYRSRNHTRQVSLLPRIDPAGYQAVPNRPGDASQQQFTQSAIAREDRDYAEFSAALKDCRLVFKRVNNSGFNSFARNGRRYYCSIFIEKGFITESVNPSLSSQHPIDLFQLISRYSPQNVLPLACNQPDFEFNSCLESGNLFAVFRRSERHYQLLMHNDTNTKGSTQWFYFEIKNRKRGKLRLSIINFYKDRSLFEQGMKVLVCSHQQQRRDSEQWQRAGENYEYREDWNLPDCNRLSFTYDFQHANDRVLFSYSFPYALQELKHYLDRLVSTHPKLIRREEICRTPLNHQVELLTIGETKTRSKDIIYVLARQHAGQSPPSFVLQGFLNSLLSNRLQAQELRRQFVFKVVPMVNVDGVSLGNYRTNLSGSDLNRKWDAPSKETHPEIFFIKQRMAQDRKQLRLFLDLHAHSRKMNSFFYGGESEDGQLHLFPFICSRLNRHISKEECSYGIDPGKKSTARAIVQNELGVRKSYTFEVSFFGYTDNQGKPGGHFDRAMLRDLGTSILTGLFYSEVKIRSREQLSELRAIMGGPQPDATFWPSKRTEDVRLVTQRLNQGRDAPTTERVESKSVLPVAVITGSIKQSVIQHAARVEQFTDQLYQKWLKERQRIRANVKKEEGSSGSDSDPEQFLLNVAESQQLEHFKHQELQEPALVQRHVEAVVLTHPRMQAHRGMPYSTVQRRSSKKQQLQTDELTHNIKVRKNGDPASFSNLQDRLAARSYLQETKEVAQERRKLSPEVKRSRYERIEDLESELQVDPLEGKFKSFHGSLEDELPSHNRSRDHQLLGETRVVYQYNVLELKKTMKFLLNIDHKERSQLQNCFEFASKNGSGQNADQPYMPLSTINKRSNSLLKGRRNKKSDCYIRKL